MSNRLSSTHAPSLFRRFILHPSSFILLLALCLPLLIWRMTFQDSFWIDEAYSAMITKHAWRDLIDLTACDIHPPGYYVLLKTWNAFGRRIGLEPGVFWGRSLNLFPWLVLAAVAWWGGRRLLGRAHGMLLTWCLMIGAHQAYVTKDMRGYAFAVPALAVAFLLLWMIEDDRRHGRLARRRAWRLWFCYALGISVALWTHLLSAPVALMLGIVWIALAGGGTWSRPFVVGGALAHGAAAVSFLPWAFQFVHQLDYWRAVPLPFLGPATLRDLILVFALWFPLGQLSSGGVLLWHWHRLIPLGALSVLVPLAGFVWMWRRGRFVDRTPGAQRDVPSLMTASAFAISLVFVLALWLVHRWGIAKVFIGPRYPVMVLGPWVIGLVGVATLATRRTRRPALWAAAMMTPWLLCGVVGQLIDIRLERFPVLRTAIREASGRVPPPGSAVYILPSDLLPYYRGPLADYELRPIEDLARAAPPDGKATILQMNNWLNLSREQDAVMRMAFISRTACDDAASSRFPSESYELAYHEIIHATGFRPEAFDRLLAAGCRTLDPPPPPGALVEVHPRDLRMRDGWNALEADQKLAAIRWTRADAAAVRLPVALAPGDYVLGLAGMRHPYPAADTPLSVSVDGEAGEATVHSPAGWMDLRIPLTLTRAHARPVVRLHYPAFAIKEFDPQSSDPRTVGLMIHRLWIEPADAADATE